MPSGLLTAPRNSEEWLPVHRPSRSPHIPEAATDQTLTSYRFVIVGLLALLSFSAGLNLFAIGPITPLIIERDSQIRRFDLNVRARYSLFDIATGGEMHSGAYRATASYNVVESAAFATRMAEEDAARKAAREVSRGIATALALYFERHGAN